MMEKARKIRQTKGITLIALVVTIVILIILATISVNLVLNGGLVKKTQSGKELHELERERERLEIVKTDVASNLNHVGKVTVDTYVEELINQGITIDEETVDNGDGSKTVITDTGYSVLIKPRGENDVEIIIEGKAGELPPRIKQVNVTKGETSIEVEVIAIRTEGATYSYEYKEVGGTWKQTGENKAKITITGTAEEKSYVIKVTVKNEYGEDTKEKTAEAEDILPEPPALSDGMIPVKYVGSSWIKTTKDDPEWYNYSSSQKKWANIVLEDSTFIKQADGTEKLDTSKAYSQLVWIPRYAYQITSYYHTTGEVPTTASTVGGNINIVFIDRQNQNKAKNKTYSTTYPSYTIGKDTGMDDYVVHPAFNFGSDKLSGLWIGKYESNHTACTTDEMGGRGYKEEYIMTIKAGVTAWRRFGVGIMFDVCRAMNNAGNPYRLNASDGVVDPHLMKNDEWGAIAYLTLSRYGNGGPTYYADSSYYITAAGGLTTSTTGNVYGIYDMNGNVIEMVAAYAGTPSGTNVASVVNAASKYKNVYSASAYASTTPSSGHYGDAIWETSSATGLSGSWYNGCSQWINGSRFFARNKDNTSGGTSIIGFAMAVDGTDSTRYGFRVAIPVVQPNE